MRYILKEPNSYTSRKHCFRENRAGGGEPVQREKRLGEP